MELQKEIINECLRGMVANNGGKFHRFKDQNISNNGVSQIILENNYTQINRICDAITIDAIGISFTSHDNSHLFYEQMNSFYDVVAKNNIYLKISSKNYLLLNINLKILLELANESKFIDFDNSMIVIKIPNLLLDRIELIGLDPDEIFEVNFDENKLIQNISQVKLYTINYLYETKLRQQHVALHDTSGCQKCIQEIIGGKLNNITWTKKSNGEFASSFNVQSDSFVKGFFIGSKNIYSLKEFALKTFTKHKIFYDRFCIYRYCIKISDNLIFVPSNPCYTNKSLNLETNNFLLNYGFQIADSFSSALDMERYQTQSRYQTYSGSKINIELVFDMEPEDLNIYILGLNIVLYKNKTLVLERSSNFTLKQNDQIVYQSDIKYIKRPGYIGFWKTGILDQEVYCWEVPVENSATSTLQSEYIKKLLNLQERIHDGDLYLGHDKCVICNQMLKLHYYKHKGLTWVHSYSHYLSEHNVAIDKQMEQMLNEEK